MKHAFFLFVGLLASGLVARGQGAIVWTADSVRRLDEFSEYKDYSSPWLSPDAQRLYFVQNNRDAYLARRSSPNGRFGMPQPVRGVPAGGRWTGIGIESLAASYSTDERTVWYTLSAPTPGGCTDRLAYRTRPTDTAAFGAERMIYLDPVNNPFAGCARSGMSNPVFSQNGQELFLSMGGANYGAVVQFRAVGVDSFVYVGHKQETGMPYNSCQLTDNDRTLLVAAGNSPGEFRRMTRASTADTFGLPQPVQLSARAPHVGPFGIANEMYYQLACNRLIMTETTPMFRVMYMFTNVARSPIQSGPTSLPAAAFQLSPNPAHHTVRLTGLPPTATTAHIIDALGRTVQTSDLAPLTSTLSLTGLPPGFYTVRVGAAARRLAVE